MKKRLLTLMTSVAMTLCITSNVFAATTYDTSKIVDFTPENVQKYETRSIPTNVTKPIKNTIQPLYSDPGKGSTQVVSTSLWSTNYLYQDGSESGVLSNIANISMSIASYFFSTPLNICKDIATYCFGLASGYIDSSRGATTFLYHSYSYYERIGQVWTGSSWKDQVEIQTREWYRHEYASFGGTNGLTYTNSYDSPYIINQDYKSHFYDDTWIEDKAYYGWSLGKPEYVDSYTDGIYVY